MPGLKQLFIKKLQMPYKCSKDQLCSEAGSGTRSGRPTNSGNNSTHLCPALLSSHNHHQILVTVKSDLI